MIRPLASSDTFLKKDKKFAAVVKKHGPLDLAGSRAARKDVFTSLLRSIVYQQISGKAAASILIRVTALFPNGKVTPLALKKMSPAKLRKAGLSPQKLSYVKDLATKYLDGTIDEKRFAQMTSDEIIEHLVAVKGIGEWTAQMLLIFTLHRPDILPTGDLGIRKGFQVVYKLKELPDKKEMEKRAKPWRSHATAASWYLWRVADSARPKTRTKEDAAKNKSPKKN